MQGFALLVSEQVHIGKGHGAPALRGARLAAHTPSLDFIWARIASLLIEKAENFSYLFYSV